MVSSPAAETIRKSANTSTYVWSGIIAVCLFGAFLPELVDPEGTLSRAAMQCIYGLKPGPSATFPCSERTFDAALTLFLVRNPQLEVAGVASIPKSRVFGSAGTRSLTVFFREK